MKRLLLVPVLATMMVLPCGLAYGTSGMTLDEVSNILGSATSDTVMAGAPIRFTIRWTHTDRPDTNITGSANGFEVYTVQSVANPGTAGFFDAITWDTLTVTPAWNTMLDASQGIVFTAVSIDGIGCDTIGFFGFSLMATGVESGFDQQVWYIETGNLTAGDTVCIDSAFYPVGGEWLWSAGDILFDIYPDWSGPHCFHVQPGSDVKTLEGPDLPTTYSLSQNYPNPFNPTTEIKFEIPTRSHVTLTVYNVLGQEVTTLVDKEMSPGRYVADWDSTSDNGKAVASGIYFYKLEAGDFIETKKMMMLK